VTQLKPITLAPHITVKEARVAVDFYVEAFGAEEIYTLPDPNDGRISHAELRFGGVMLMLSDEYPDFGALSPETVGGSPIRLYIEVADIDEMFSRALKLGATEIRPVKDQFFGERSGMLLDPFGHTWTLSMKIEDVSSAEIQKRWSEMVQG